MTDNAEGTPIGPGERLGSDALVFVLIGASAVGKSTFAGRLCAEGVADATPTWTTRKPREQETDTDYDHHFVSDADFNRQSAEGHFMDERELYGFRYGLPFPEEPSEGREALIVLKPLFIPRFLRFFPLARIYQIDASEEVVPERMEARGQSPADIERRLQLHEAETQEAARFANVIFDNNGPPDLAYAQLVQQMFADRAAYDARSL